MSPRALPSGRSRRQIVPRQRRRLLLTVCMLSLSNNESYIRLAVMALLVLALTFLTGPTVATLNLAEMKSLARMLLGLGNPPTGVSAVNRLKGTKADPASSG